MSSKRVLEVLQLCRKVWDLTAPVRDTSKALDSVVLNLAVSPPVPCDDEDLIKLWAQLRALDRHVLTRMETSREYEFNVFSKQETMAGHLHMAGGIETAKKIKNVAQLTRIVAVELKSARSPTGFLIRLVTMDFPTTSLYAGREPLIDEIVRLADSVIQRCEVYARTRENMVRDTRWILDLHSMR